MHERRTDANLSHVGRPRLSHRGKSDWRSKLHPLFLEAASALKNAVSGQAAGLSTAREEFLAKIEELRRGFLVRKSGPPLPADIIYSGTRAEPIPPNEIAKGLLAWVHWNRCRTPLWHDALRASDGDVGASRRITETIAEYDRRRSDPNWRPKFKIDLDHAPIF